MGRVFTPEGAKVLKPAEAHANACRHDGFAKAGDLEWLLLRPWQHKIATRSACGDAKNRALPRFLIADRLERGWPIRTNRCSGCPCTKNPRGSWHQGFRLASPSVRPASSGWTDLDWRAGMPERGTTGTKPSASTMYGWNLPLASKGLAAATETSHFGVEWRQNRQDRQLPLTGATANGVKRASRGTGFGGTSQNRNFSVYRRPGMRLGRF